MSDRIPNTRNIAVYCASSEGLDPSFMRLAKDTGTAIATRGYGLVYGGGGAGLMGQTARAVLENGGTVLGVIPEFLMNAENAMSGIRQKIVPDMHARKLDMFNAADAFIILPGGIGTLEEAVEVISWQRLQLHQKPIVFVSETDYWTPLMSFMQQTIDVKLSPSWLLGDIFLASSANDALDRIETDWASPPKDLKPVVPISKV